MSNEDDNMTLKDKFINFVNNLIHICDKTLLELNNTELNNQFIYLRSSLSIYKEQVQSLELDSDIKVLYSKVSDQILGSFSNLSSLLTGDIIQELAKSRIEGSFDDH